MMMMDEDAPASTSYAVHCALTLPNRSCTPSPGALALSADGQFASVTRGQIHILTYALGIVQNEQKLKRARAPGLAREQQQHGKGKRKGDGTTSTTDASVSYLVSALRVDRKNVIDYVDILADARAQPHHGTDADWKTVSWSPAGVTALGGCALATCTTNGEVYTYEARKDPVLGPWVETCDLTAPHLDAALKKLPALKTNSPSVQEFKKFRRRTLNTLISHQASTISWSHAVRTSVRDRSLLALGHRDGSVSIWRRDSGRNGSMRRVARAHASGVRSQPTLIQWSEWFACPKRGKDAAVAVLAVAHADGMIVLYDVSQNCEEKDKDDGGQEEEEHEATLEPVITVVAHDHRPASQMLWIDPSSLRREEGRMDLDGGGGGGDEPAKLVLVWTKLGQVHAQWFKRDTYSGQLDSITLCGVSLPNLQQHDDASSSSSSSLYLEPWAGSTPYGTCCGLSHDAGVLTLALSSGCFYRVKIDLSARERDTGSALTVDLPASLALSMASRKVYCLTTPSRRNAELSDSGVSREHGPLSLGWLHLGRDLYGWVYSEQDLSSFRYKQLREIKSTFVIASLTDHEVTELPTRWSAEDPDPSLRSLRSSVGLMALLASPDRDEILPTLASMDQLGTMQSAVDARAFFGDDDERKLETGIGQALAALFYDNAEARLHQSADIHVRFLKNVDGAATRKSAEAAHVVARVEHFVHLGLAALLDALSSVAALDEQEKAIVARISEVASRDPSDPTPAPSSLSEDCPVCAADVPFETGQAKCRQGHVWQRCSLTLELLATTSSRTCCGCGRKALVTLPATITPHEDSQHEAINALLGQVNRCVYCGGSWRRLR